MSAMSRTSGWFEHLTEGDLGVLDVVAPDAGIDPTRMRRDEAVLATVLSHPAAVWVDRSDDGLVRSSPFLAFATAVHRGWVDLGSARHVDEWVGWRQRLPVLGADDLRAFLAGWPAAAVPDVAPRLLYAGGQWERLDPHRPRLSPSAVQRAGPPPPGRAVGGGAGGRTAGGVPASGCVRSPPPRAACCERERSTGGGPNRDRVDTPGSVGLLERLGPRWYELACRAVDPPLTGQMEVVAGIAERFNVARRVLNLLTDRHLSPVRGRLFRRLHGLIRRPSGRAANRRSEASASGLGARSLSRRMDLSLGGRRMHGLAPLRRLVRAQHLPLGGGGGAVVVQRPTDGAHVAGAPDEPCSVSDGGRVGNAADHVHERSRVV